MTTETFQLITQTRFPQNVPERQSFLGLFQSQSGEGQWPPEGKLISLAELGPTPGGAPHCGKERSAHNWHLALQLMLQHGIFHANMSQREHSEQSIADGQSSMPPACPESDRLIIPLEAGGGDTVAGASPLLLILVNRWVRKGFALAPQILKPVLTR